MEEIEYAMAGQRCDNDSHIELEPERRTAEVCRASVRSAGSGAGEFGLRVSTRTFCRPVNTLLENSAMISPA